jgi:hypothetical protein
MIVYQEDEAGRWQYLVDLDKQEFVVRRGPERASPKAYGMIWNLCEYTNWEWMTPDLAEWMPEL